MSNSVQFLEKITADDKSNIGGKAANLAKLLQANLPVPGGIAVGLNAFDGSGTLKADAKVQIKSYVEPGKTYAVRSSALAEDTVGASWAGQFETYLDIASDNVVAKVELCHNTARNRAKAYADDKANNSFDIAVVVQEMLKPDYAGVLFTKDPVTGANHLVTEYVEGLGEELVSGRADPKKVIIEEGKELLVPFDVKQLAELARKVEELFNGPQDIEWVWADNKIWLVQARPITATQESRKGYYIGEPEDLFYWGPARANPTYFSDFMVGVERFFVEAFNNPNLPKPPKTIALFHEGKNVWLINAKAFADFTEKIFETYEKLDQLDKDISSWKVSSEQLNKLTGSDLEAALVDAWYHTEFAEFSLYGAEASLTKRLSRFDAKTRQDIWGAFTVPDKQTFLAAIDTELYETQDPEAMAKKYPWINDGYDGVAKVGAYFKDRLKIVGDETHDNHKFLSKRKEIIKKAGLSKDEVNSLTLARKLAEFMDDRKAWMMQTRHLITKPLIDIQHGWFFKDGKATTVGEADARELWQRYIDFKTSTNSVVGIVASNGSKHFVRGEVAVVTGPTDRVEDGKIVVVPSTSPSYVPLMRKAKALVTDHGGMMSHAAIVAREFNLPCIVGTKNATKVLKTGDNVLLDLVKGEVIA